MCGICGIIRFDNAQTTENEIRRMMKSMKHRGPDDEGIFTDNNLGLGFVRLSILDLSPLGNQPMKSLDGRYCIVFNGEIYNYLEIKDLLSSKGHRFVSTSDTEVLLNSYIEWGEDCLEKFNGMFSFVIYDIVGKKIFAARDRFGVKPFYYYSDGAKFVFASEIPAIFEAGDISREPNDDIVFTYLAYNRTDFDEQTFFRGIRKLQHGCKLSFQTTKYKIEPVRWYNLRDRVTTPFSGPEEFAELFTDSVRLRLRSDVPVSLSLSGGLDSSSILSVLLKKIGRNDIHTFSAVYGKGKSGDESDFIDHFNDEKIPLHFTIPTADSLHSELTDFIKTQTEPVQSTSIYALYKVLQLISSEGIKVTLTGQGADEQFAGYHYFFGQYFKELLLRFKLSTLIHEVMSYYRNHKSFSAYRYFLFYNLNPDLQNRVVVNIAKYLDKDYSGRYSGKEFKMINLYNSWSLNESLLNHFEYKLEHLLKWDDINSMRFSVETRVPFLDYRLVEKTLALPSGEIIKNGTTKYLLREAMKGLLPEPIRNRHTKIGFSTPDDEWFRSAPIYKTFNDIIRSGSFRNRGYINTRLALDRFEKHAGNRASLSKEIWKWINLELWFREFIDYA